LLSLSFFGYIRADLGQGRGFDGEGCWWAAPSLVWPT